MRYILLFLVLLYGCRSNNDNIPRPQSLDELVEILYQPDIQICKTDISNVLNGDTDKILETLGPDFTKFRFGESDVKISETQIPIFSIDAVLDYSRSNALRRRLLAGSDGSNLAQTYYDEFGSDLSVADTLQEHTSRLKFWWKRVSEEQKREDQDSADFNIRYCVINELRGHDLVAARTHLLSLFENKALPSPAYLKQYFEQDRFPPDDFKTNIMQRVFEKGNLSPLDMALLRGRQNPILSTDPKTAEDFWRKRDVEIDAILDRIENHAYSNSAARLQDMVHIDQTLRGLWPWSRRHKNVHFYSTADRESFETGISERVVRVDQANTETLKSMLEGRSWFNDETDGDGAAHNAWLIAQHADLDPDFQERALELIETSLDNPGVSKTNYAYLFDRVMVKKTGGADFNMDNAMQRYATQGRCQEGEWEPFTLEDPKNIDAIRAEIGLGTLADYKARVNCPRN